MSASYKKGEAELREILKTALAVGRSEADAGMWFVRDAQTKTMLATDLMVDVFLRVLVKFAVKHDLRLEDFGTFSYVWYDFEDGPKHCGGALAGLNWRDGPRGRFWPRTWVKPWRGPVK
jgi:hypothetical protein